MLHDQAKSLLALAQGHFGEFPLVDVRHHPQRCHHLSLVVDDGIGIDQRPQLRLVLAKKLNFIRFTDSLTTPGKTVDFALGRSRLETP